MKKLFLLSCVLVLVMINAKAQPFAIGARVAVVYSYLSLSGAETPLETTGSSIGYQAGVFLRKDFRKIYLEANVLYTGNVGGTYVYSGDEQKTTASFVSLPLIMGKKFFPGIRLFAGAVPYMLLSKTDFALGELMQASNMNYYSGGVALNFLVGGGLDFSKLTLSIQYEGGLINGFMHHQSNYEEDWVWHRIPMVSLGLAIRLN
jgi:hypothetical protein